MLVLQRTLGQKIMISDDIVITVVEIKGGSIKIGIDAPCETRVDREEVRVAVDRDARLAERERQAGR